MKKCKVCGVEYAAMRPLQKVCSPKCALVLVREKAQARERKETRQKLQALETRTDLVKKAQAAFNAFIRARDLGRGCISCGSPLTTEPNTYDCGHYRSVGSAPHMRFVEDNAHGQCKKCNRYLSGNHVEYRKGLLERVGPRAVELIEADNTLRKYTREGLIEIARYYREQKRLIQRLRNPD